MGITRVTIWDITVINLLTKSHDPPRRFKLGSLSGGCRQLKYVQGTAVGEDSDELHVAAYERVEKCPKPQTL